MNNIANIYEYVCLDQDNPIGYTYDLYTCISVLFHTKYNSILTHIFMSNDSYDFNQLYKALESIHDSEVCAELFITPFANTEGINNIKEVLDINNISYEIYEAYLSKIDGKGSIGYNVNSKEYYGLDNDYKLIPYKPYVLKKKKGEI